jgi:hypothetical protein
MVLAYFLVSELNQREATDFEGCLLWLSRWDIGSDVTEAPAIYLARAMWAVPNKHNSILQHAQQFLVGDFVAAHACVADPSDPEIISSVGIGGPQELWSKGSMHSTWLGWDGDLLIETPEVFNPAAETAENGNGDNGHDHEASAQQQQSTTESAFGYPRFTDISNPGQPAPVGGFEMDSTRMDPEDLPPGDWTTHDPKIRPGLPGADTEGHAYISWYSEGVPVVDSDDVIAASDLDAGVTAGEEDALVAQFMPENSNDPFGLFQPADVEFPFIWGVFLHEDFRARRPFAHYALASDINSGLWTFQLDEETAAGQRPAHGRP